MMYQELHSYKSNSGRRIHSLKIPMLTTIINNAVAQLIYEKLFIKTRCN